MGTPVFICFLFEDVVWSMVATICSEEYRVVFVSAQRWRGRIFEINISKILQYGVELISFISFLASALHFASHFPELYKWERERMRERERRLPLLPAS